MTRPPSRILAAAALLAAMLLSTRVAAQTPAPPPAVGPVLQDLFAAIDGGKLDEVKAVVRKDRTLIHEELTVRAGKHIEVFTALTMAVRTKQREIAKYLFYAGASPVQGRPHALEAARKQSDSALIALFQTRQGPIDAPKAEGKPRKPAQPDPLPYLNEMLVDFAQRALGRTVGSGQCADLANIGLRTIGAVPRLRDFPNEGDYVWGELVCEIRPGADSPSVQVGPAGKGNGATPILPGDVIQYRDVVLEGKRGMQLYQTTAPHHTAIVEWVSQDGATIRVLEQNSGGVLQVLRGEFTPNDLKRGWLRVYRPIPRS